MGFLGFGSKKKKELSPLDLPPSPPEMQADFPPMPDLPKLDDLPPLPRMGDFPRPTDLKPAMQIGSGPMQNREQPPRPPKPLELKMPPMPKLPPMPEPEEAFHEEDFDIPEPRDIAEKKPVSMRVPPIAPLPQMDEKKIKYPGINPLFMKSADYQSVMAGLSGLKSRIKETESLLDEITGLKKEKEEHLEEWRTLLEDMQRKLVYIDKKIFEA